MISLIQQRTSWVRVAELVTGVFAPAHLVIGLLLLVGATSHPSSLHGLTWGALAGFLVGAAPYAWVIHSVRRGRLVSRHIPDRRQRILPLAIAGTFAIAGLVVLALLGAPRELVALVTAMLAGLVATGAITMRWKISLHTAVAGGTVAVLAIVFGPALLGTAGLVALVGWSRIAVRHHTVAQVMAGALLGSIIATAVFVPLTDIAS